MPEWERWRKRDSWTIVIPFFWPRRFPTAPFDVIKRFWFFPGNFAHLDLDSLLQGPVHEDVEGEEELANCIVELIPILTFPINTAKNREKSSWNRSSFYTTRGWKWNWGVCSHFLLESVTEGEICIFQAANSAWVPRIKLKKKKKSRMDMNKGFQSLSGNLWEDVLELQLNHCHWFYSNWKMCHPSHHLMI